MRLKSEKGATGIDIAIAIVILGIFIALIASLMYGINQSSRELSRKNQATNYAISEIERLKSENLDKLESNAISGYIEGTPYYKKVTIVDYADLEENKGKDVARGLIKKVTVEISYKSGRENKSVELTTAISKEN